MENKTVVIVCAAPVLAAKEAVFSFWGFPYPHLKSHWQCFGNMKRILYTFQSQCKLSKVSGIGVEPLRITTGLFRTLKVFLPLLLSAFLSSFQKQPHEYKVPQKAEGQKPVEPCAADVTQAPPGCPVFVRLNKPTFCGGMTGV